MATTQVSKTSRNQNLNFRFVFSVSKCHLSPRVGIVFEVSLIVTKFSISFSNYSTMDPWPELKF